MPACTYLESSLPPLLWFLVVLSVAPSSALSDSRTSSAVVFLYMQRSFLVLVPNELALISYPSQMCYIGFYNKHTKTFGILSCSFFSPQQLLLYLSLPTSSFKHFFLSSTTFSGCFPACCFDHICNNFAPFHICFFSCIDYIAKIVNSRLCEMYVWPLKSMLTRYQYNAAIVLY